jgi:hypothetical protein
MISMYPCKFSLSVETRDVVVFSCMGFLMQDVVVDLDDGRLVRLQIIKMHMGWGICVKV